MKYNLMFLDQILFFINWTEVFNFLIFNEPSEYFHMHNLDIKMKI